MTTTLFQQECLQQIEEKLKELLTFPDSPQEKLFEAARYSVLNGGKRLRPLLVLSSCLSFGGDFAAALIPACALELVHCYSLIHDDLPAMDDDDFRRGKPSLHKQTNEGIAILAGDFLLTYAFELLAQAPNLTDTQRLALVTVLSKAAGGQGMVGGQLLDLETKETPASLEGQTYIHIKKTAELLACGVVFGAIIANAKEHELALSHSAGLDIGLAFQVQDDILDADEQDEDASTFIAHYGLAEAKQVVKKYKLKATASLAALPLQSPHLAELMERMVP